MLPSHDYYGKKKRGAGFWLTSICAVLLLGSLGACYYLFARNATLDTQVRHLQQSFDTHQDKSQRSEAAYQMLHKQHTSMQKMYSDTQSSLRSHAIKSDRVDSLEHELTSCNRLMEFEKKTRNALHAKLQELEEHFKEREKDWHQLSDSWNLWQKEATAENLKLLNEMKECGIDAVSKHKGVQYDPELEVPKFREESNMDFDVQLEEIPQVEEFHPHEHQLDPSDHEGYLYPPAVDTDGRHHYDYVYDHHYDHLDHWAHEDEFDPGFDNFHGEDWVDPHAYAPPPVKEHAVDDSYGQWREENMRQHHEALRAQFAEEAGHHSQHDQDVQEHAYKGHHGGMAGTYDDVMKILAPYNNIRDHSLLVVTCFRVCEP
eukprot:gene18010-24420_t